MAVEAQEFRHALGHYAAEVTVVTTCDAGERFGITVTSFCSLSLDPPLVLVCIDKRARIHEHLRVGGSYAVNFLAVDQEDVSRRFASRSSDPFEGLDVRAGKLGAPLFRGTLAAVECEIVDALPGGDHTIFVGRVEASHVAGGSPLVHFRGQYRHLE